MARDAGVTLIEMLVALAIFAVIGLAGTFPKQRPIEVASGCSYVVRRTNLLNSMILSHGPVGATGKHLHMFVGKNGYLALVFFCH